MLINFYYSYLYRVPEDKMKNNTIKRLYLNLGVEFVELAVGHGGDAAGAVMELLALDVALGEEAMAILFAALQFGHQVAFTLGESLAYLLNQATFGTSSQ